jgi:hypothetical protein
MVHEGELKMWFNVLVKVLYERIYIIIGNIKRFCIKHFFIGTIIKIQLPEFEGGKVYKFIWWNDRGIVYEVMNIWMIIPKVFREELFTILALIVFSYEGSVTGLRIT